MPQAAKQSITSSGYLPLSSIIADPYVRRAFNRSERDLGGALVLFEPGPSTIPPAGAAVVVRELELAGERS